MNEQQYFNYLSLRFRKAFHESFTPEWNCPHCSSGMLHLDGNSLTYEETAESAASRRGPDWEPDWLDFHFTARFECNRCPGKTIAVGSGHDECFLEGYPDGDAVWMTVFMPEFFYPALPIFKIPAGCPDAIKNTLRSAFKVAWADFPAAGNRLRVAIENLVVEIDPSTQALTPLHKKIEALDHSHPEISKWLMAIKWLGNSASHFDNLRECDLKFGFDTMELVLQELYTGDRRRISQLAHEIIQNKGPVGL